MHKKLYLLLVLLSGSFLCPGRDVLSADTLKYNEIGNPYIMDPMQELQAGTPQTWFIWQSREKIVYISNTALLLEYDGTNWKKININNGRVVSMDSGPANTIYVATDYDFGYLKADSSRKFVFASLLATLPEQYRENIKMLSCIATSKGVYFISKSFVLLFKGNTAQPEVRKAQSEIIRTFRIGDEVYALQKGIGLTQISEKEQRPIPGSEFLDDEGMIGMFKQVDGSFLICTRIGKFYRYDGHTFRFSFSLSRTYDINHRCYQPVVQLPDGRFAFATRTQGIVLFSKDGTFISAIDRSSGLRTNLVNALKVDSDGSLWAALDNGVNRVEISSPLTFMDERSGLEGAVLRIVRHKGVLYFATMTGLFRHVTDQPRFTVKPWKNLQHTMWDMYSEGDLLLVATTFGVYQVTEGEPVLLTSKDHYCRSIVRSKKRPDVFYAGTSTGILIIRRISTIKWEVIREVNFARGFVLDVKEDTRGDLWATAYNDGYYRIKEPLQTDSRKTDAAPAVVQRYDLSHGLQLMQGNKIFEVNGELVFSSGNKLLQYDDQKDRFVQQRVVPDKEDTIRFQVFRVREDKNKNIYINLGFGDKNRVVVLDKFGNLIPNPFFAKLEKRTLYDMLIDSDSIVWLGGPSGITRVDLHCSNGTVIPAFETMVRTVTLNQDSILFGGRHDDNFSILLPYQKSNVLRFEFGAPSFDDVKENQFQYFLEGYNQDWSEWTHESWKDYTDLREGNYRMHVRAKNVYNMIGQEAILNIVILPPWYRTWWAYLFYAALVLFAVWGFVRWRLTRLYREKAQLEQIVSDRTKELATRNGLLEDQTQKLQALDNVKSQFFANISHEFRTPLTLILGPLEQYVSKPSDTMPNETMRMMYRNSKRLHQLIDQLLDITKLDNGSVRLTVVQHDICHFMRMILPGFNVLAIQKKIDFQYALPETSCLLFYDSDKLEKILYNLLSNAFKFTQGGGTVTIAVSLSAKDKNFTKKIDAVPEWMQIIVRDSGIGMQPGELPKIFDRFYRVNASGTSEYSGTGIGLALVKELVKLYGGTIEVSSEVGKGSIFTVILPVAEHTLPQHEIADFILSTEKTIFTDHLLTPERYDDEEEIVDPDTEDEKITVLVAEDNADLYHYIKNALKDYCDCIPAINGKEGMSKALAIIPDLVITDVMMPEVDGLQFCHQLKTDERTSHIPVIMLTAKAGQSSKIEGLKTGADDYISKPFDMEELKLKIQNLIALRNSLRIRYTKKGGVEPGEIAVNSLDEVFLKKILTLIEEKMTDSTFSVERLVDESGVSRMQLHRKLKALTGQSAGDLIRTLRLKRAAQLLRKNSDIISQIGYQVGFSDHSYFARCFRRQFGMSPSDYAARTFAVSNVYTESGEIS